MCGCHQHHKKDENGIFQPHKAKHVFKEDMVIGCSAFLAQLSNPYVIFHFDKRQSNDLVQRLHEYCSLPGIPTSNGLQDDCYFFFESKRKESPNAARDDVRAFLSSS